MSIELSHITIPARSKWASATFLAGILDVPTGPPRNLSVPVTLSNGVTLDYVDADGFTPQHHAFLASEAEFDAAFARLRSTGITYYAGPRHQRPGEISHGRDGRRVYFDDPNGHTIELATRLLGLPVHQGNLNTTERVAKSPPSAGCAPRPRRPHRSACVHHPSLL